jgi:hypothetical protein
VLHQATKWKDLGVRKIFQIGFNRCGTTTLFSFFQRNKISSVHWDGGRLAKCFRQRKQNGEDPFRDYQDVVFFSDMMFLSNDEVIEPYRDFEYIHSHYPDSYYILNTRRLENWIKSRVSHGDFAQRYQKVYDLENIDAVMRHWRLTWYQQHYRVLKYFESCPERILYFDIEVDGAQKLVQFLDKDFKLEPNLYFHENRSLAPKVVWSMSMRMTNRSKSTSGSS